MESFTIDPVANATSQLFPDNTLNFPTNFLLEQMNVDGEWELAMSELINPSMYQNVMYYFLECKCAGYTMCSLLFVHSN